ncbi:Putative sugar transporter ERD6-like 13 (plasmid) [Levilactobacillus brevis]|nr:Putative sugar transporter ERD6-like 13 [Levilactobacillus brevis]
MLFIGMWRVPESPRWLVMKGKQKSALEVLQRIRSSHQQSLQEIQSVDSVMKRNKDIKRAHFRDLSHPWVRNLVLIGIGLGILQQFVGINIMMYYGTSILMKVGFGHRAALIANIGNGLTSFIATAVGMQLMYTVNRRRMLLTGIIGTGSSMAMLTLAIIWLKGTIVLPYVVISMTMCFLAFFQSCVSPTTWVLLSEIFPQSLRGLGMGISTFCLWLANFMVGFTFPIMMAHWGGVGTFAFFITCNILSLFFAYSFVPETQGKTLEQIQIELRQRTTIKRHHHHHPMNSYG